MISTASTLGAHRLTELTECVATLAGGGCKLKLSKCAEEYEREQGKIRCPQWEINSGRVRAKIKIRHC